MGHSDLRNPGEATPQIPRWRRPAFALVLSGVLHLLILGLPGPREPRVPSESALEVEIEVLPGPVREVVEAPAPAEPERPVPEPDVPRPSDPVPEPATEHLAGQSAEPTTSVGDRVARELTPEPRVPEPVLSDGEPVSEAPPVLDDPALVTRLLAAPFERDTPPGPFDRPVPNDPAPVDFRFPERESMISLLSPALQDLPFADPGLNVFMYSPDWQGNLHRGFDKITPVFGWNTNSGLMIRCRFILIAVGCGWGRSRYSPSWDKERQAREKERRERDANKGPDSKGGL